MKDAVKSQVMGLTEMSLKVQVARPPSRVFANETWHRPLLTTVTKVLSQKYSWPPLATRSALIDPLVFVRLAKVAVKLPVAPACRKVGPLILLDLVRLAVLATVSEIEPVAANDCGDSVSSGAAEKTTAKSRELRAMISSIKVAGRPSVSC